MYCGEYLDYKLTNALSTKVSFAKNLIVRVQQLVTESKDKEIEFNLVMSAFITNNHPKNSVKIFIKEDGKS